jgi:AraC-like DNA-binding protein
VVPDARAEIVLHLGEPFRLVDECGAARRQARALAAGQLLGPIRLEPSSEADVVGIRFRSEAAGAALGPSLADLTGLVAPLAEVNRTMEGRLLDAVARDAAPVHRAAALSAALSRLALKPPGPLVHRAVTALSEASGRPARIQRLARALGTTTRTLERRVRDATGLSPGLLLAISRFRRAFRALGRAPAGSWARVAVDSGYYDQAHLIREFRRFAGAPPGRFFQVDAELARALAGAD